MLTTTSPRSSSRALAGTDAGILKEAAAAALVNAGDRASALNSFASAARFYDEALVLGVGEPDRPRVLFWLGAALHLAGDERRIEILEQAHDALVAAGDPETAAEASLLLAEAWWYCGQRDRAFEHLEHAREFVRDRGNSPAAARVLAQVGRYSMLAGSNEDAQSTGREALTMAEQLGLEDVRVLALNVIGTSRVNAGDRGGIADLERALELALAASSPEAARVYNNLGSVLAGQGEIRRAGELWREGKEVAERLGNATVSRYLDGVIVWFDYYTGGWEEALRGANAFIAECDAGSPHYLHAEVLGIRARILLASDDVEGRKHRGGPGRRARA